MGYEYDVRVCIECFKNITDNDRISLAVCQEAKHQVAIIIIISNLFLLLSDFLIELHFL